MFIVEFMLFCLPKSFLASSVNESMRVDGPRISKVKPTPRPEANQFPTPIQKPIVDSDSGGIRIIPIQVDPGYQPRREANVVYGERCCTLILINHTIFLSKC